jgi:hypothetical protein
MLHSLGLGLLLPFFYFVLTAIPKSSHSIVRDQSVIRRSYTSYTKRIQKAKKMESLLLPLVTSGSDQTKAVGIVQRFKLDLESLTVDLFPVLPLVFCSFFYKS